jgi:hypothetical protein
MANRAELYREKAEMCRRRAELVRNCSETCDGELNTARPNDRPSQCREAPRDQRHEAVPYLQGRELS